MKIGLVRRGYSDTGGAERYLIRFAAGLEERGHECVLFSDREWPGRAWGDREQVVLKHAGSPGDFAVALDDAKPKERHCDFLFSLERVWSCDCYRAGDGVHAAWLKRRARFEPKWRSWFRGLNLKHEQILRLEEALYGPKSCAHIIANGSFVKTEITETYGTDPEKITVIPNGFDPPAFDPETCLQLRERGRKLHGLSPDTVAFLFVGSGWERKGLRFAMEAVESLAKQGCDVKLFVAGKDRSGPPRSKIKGVTEFLGPVGSTELAQLYEVADVFVLPTIYDPFSNACLEAASHGLPVITTNANGIADLFPELQGDIVSDLKSREVVEACAGWISLDRRMAARTVNREVASKFSIARNVEATLACFEKLI